MIEYERVRAVVNLNHIKENVIKLKELVNPTSKIMMIVKADGYGHGANEIAQIGRAHV